MQIGTIRATANSSASDKVTSDLDPDILVLAYMPQILHTHPLKVKLAQIVNDTRNEVKQVSNNFNSFCTILENLEDY